MLPGMFCVVVIRPADTDCGFGTAAYKGALGLRGEAPTSLTWISAEEFEGPERP